MNDNENALPEPRWISGSENPFGVLCLDLRSLTRKMVSTTDPETRKKFLSLRENDGEEYRRTCLEWGLENLHDEGISCPPFPGFGIGPLFKAACLEEKWDIYFLDGETHGQPGYDSVLFCRSWTGEMLFRILLIEQNSDSFDMAGLQIAPKKKHLNPAHIYNVADYLIKSHIFNLEVPAPMTQEMISMGDVIAVVQNEDGLNDIEKVGMVLPDEEIAIRAFKEYGWRAGYITPEYSITWDFDFDLAQKLPGFESKNG